MKPVALALTSARTTPPHEYTQKGPDGGKNGSARLSTSAGDDNYDAVAGAPLDWTFRDMCAPCRVGHWKESVDQGAWCVPCAPGSYAHLTGTCFYVRAGFCVCVHVCVRERAREKARA